MMKVAARDKMQFDDLRLGVIFMLIWLEKCSGANPTVTLNPVSSVYFDVGGSMSLVCEVNQDIGVTKIYFSRNNNVQVSVSPSTCTVFPSIVGDPHTYNSTCSQRRIFTLRRNGVGVDDHRTTWSCQVLTSSGTCASSSSVSCSSPVISICLRVPVSTLQIMMTGYGQVLSSSVNIVRGQSTDIICSTAPNGSRPRATFQWYIRQGNQSPLLIVDQSISPTPDPITVPGQPEVDLLISYSTWTLTGNASYQDMYIYCEARDETNTGNYAKSDEIRVNIMYPPALLLSTYQSIYNVTEGMPKFVFTCNIIEANPLPQANSYRWFHKTSTIQGQNSSSYILPNVQRSDAGEYRCRAWNEYGSGTSNSLEVIVQYPPNISVILTGSAQQNQTAILVCRALGVPAETTFYPWIHMWDGLVIRTGLQGQTNSTHSMLTLDRLSLESMGTYVCTASNGIMGNSGKLKQSDSESLRVKGAASILTENARFVGNISLSANMSISFYCDPPIERFAIWKRSKEIMNTSRTMTSLSSDIENYIFHNKAIQLNVQKANFFILNVTVEDFDNYTLVLMNSFGSTSFQFHLDPFDGTVIKDFSVQRGTTVNENESATFQCSVDSYPKSTITLKREGDGTILKTEVNALQCQYWLPSAHCLDTDNYTCYASNNISQPADRTIQLLVKCHPRLDFRAPFVNVTYSKHGGDAVLRYTVISYPPPRFTWTFLGNGSLSRGLPNSAIQSDYGQQSELRFIKLDVVDFGSYRVIADNTINEPATAVLWLLLEGTAGKPFNFHATNVHENQLSLKWQSGFNGGFTQTFVVELSLDNITWNNVSEVNAGNRDGWFSTVIEDLIPGSEYYLRLYAYNIHGRGDYADVQLVIRMLKEVGASAGIGVGGAVGIGVGGIIIGFIAAIIAFTIRRHLKGHTNSCLRSKEKTDEEMHPYSNTEMNLQPIKTIYEELNKGNTEQSVYDKISPLEG